MIRTASLLALVALAAPLALAAPDEPSLAWEGAPTVGVPTLLTLARDDRPVQGATVRVFHREDLDGATELAVGITDRRGEVEWIPRHPGPARLVAGEVEARAAVSPGSLPWGTAIAWVLLLLAGVGALLVSRRAPAPSRS